MFYCLYKYYAKHDNLKKLLDKYLNISFKHDSLPFFNKLPNIIGIIKYKANFVKNILDEIFIGLIIIFIPKIKCIMSELYKAKDLKVYGSSEWMFGSTKKYRQVFDRYELDYVGAEFSFYNKMFDEKDWKAKLTLRAIDRSEAKVLCELTEEINISKEENVVYYYKSWGNKSIGTYWKNGNYLWEALIDGQLVMNKEFYVYELGLVTPTSNPYLEVVSLSLFNGDKEGKNLQNGKFLKTFKREETFYVWSEIRIKPKTNDAFKFEFYLNYRDDAGQLKGQIHRIYDIPKRKKGDLFKWEDGWGNASGGSFTDTKYFVELVFMDTIIATNFFEVGNEFVEGNNQNQVSPQGQSSLSVSTPKQEKVETMEDVLAELNALIGLSDIKRKISEHISYLEFLKIRKEKGFEESGKISLHTVFTGNPGTGKTTIVKILGRLYKQMGLLENGLVHEVDRADLVGQYIGQTAPRVKKAIEDARGGILFVDEAYALIREKSDNDYGKEVIEILLKEMSEGDGATAIMFAGYPAEMQVFLDYNPGLRSRINYYFHFDDYTPEELLQIADFACKKRSVILTSEARSLIEKHIWKVYRDRDKSFGNARFAFSIIDQGKMHMGLRIMQIKNYKNLDKEELSTITLEDIQAIIPDHGSRTIEIPIDDALLKSSLQELNVLVGLDSVKTDINELVKLVRYYRETGKDVLNKFSLHTVFIGNPGTGKTTIARIIGKIYKALGLLERGHLVEVDREALVAGFVGQTAIKTKQVVDNAMGGVLFIDEAYALSDGSDNDFGKEAIEVILKQMEDQRGKFSLIVAGYPAPMQNFLMSNPGLKSRFDRTMQFSDYSLNELLKIADIMFAREGLRLSESAQLLFKSKMELLLQSKDQYFGNAREIRKITEFIVKKQNLRLAELPAGARTQELIETIDKEDIEHIVIEAKQTSQGLGFAF